MVARYTTRIRTVTQCGVVGNISSDSIQMTPPMLVSTVMQTDIRIDVRISTTRIRLIHSHSQGKANSVISSIDLLVLAGTDTPEGMASWSILPTTADVGFLAEGENIVELFKISSLALQSIRYGLAPETEIHWEEGEQISFSISRSDREDRDLVSWLEEVNWLSETGSSMLRIICVSISDDQILSEAVKFEIDEFEPVIEIKAVTHHDLEIGVKESEDGSIIGLWARVILDV